MKKACCWVYAFAAKIFLFLRKDYLCALIIILSPVDCHKRFKITINTMCPYIYDSNLSYQDYLQVKSFKDEIEAELSKETERLIASEKQIHKEQRKSLEQFENNMLDGFSTISSDLKEINSTFRELNTTFQWGISEILIELGNVSDSLSKLVQIAKTPAQTWAYEQYEVARDAFRQGLYEESLDYLELAINGNKGHIGYKIDYRFYYLKGIILVGSFQNSSLKTTNLEQAEKAFLLAVRYAKKDYKKEAARAFLAAGWAAYCRGKIDRSIQHTEKAFSFNPKFGEAYFQAAKFKMHKNLKYEGIEYLKKAININPRYILKAAKDGDFKKHEKELNSLIKSLRSKKNNDYVKLEEKYNNLKTELEHLLSKFKNRKKDHRPTLLKQSEEIKSEAKIEVNSKSFLGFLEAEKLLDSAIDKIKYCIEIEKKLLKKEQEEIKRKLKKEDYQKRKIDLQSKKNLLKGAARIIDITIGLILGGGAGFIFGGITLYTVLIPVTLVIVMFLKNYEYILELYIGICTILGAIYGIILALEGYLVKWVEKIYSKKISDLN